MISLLKRLRKGADDKGMALPFVAMMLVLLLGVTAFAVDLGWLYLNGSRIQRGADAAALAGVVHLPANTAQVNAQSVNGANANGWDIGSVNGNPIAGGGPDSLAWQPLSDNRLEVDVTATVPTFFLRIFGIDDLTMTRTATAEYIKPVPMGSPSACFGIGAFAASLTGDHSLAAQGLGHCSSFEMNFWAAINGRRTAKEHGDPYAVSHLAFNNNTGSGCDSPIGPENLDYRPNGYYYGIEVPEDVTSFEVKIFDAGFYHRATPQTETGDFGSLRCSFGGGPTTVYTVYQPDEFPLDPGTNNVQACTPQSFAPAAAAPNNTRNQWRTICTVSGDTQGMFVLNVRTTGNGGGNNSYSVGVTTNGGNARVYAINDMSIFTNADATGSTATVYLAEVDEFHAGKTLQLGFYDPGENFAANEDAYVTVRTPSGSIPNCQWDSHHDTGASGPSGSGQCRVQTTEAASPQSIPLFNGYWLNATIGIPSGYSCSTDCFWTMELDMGQSQDRTTWSARVIGNPVRLVPNEP